MLAVVAVVAVVVAVVEIKYLIELQSSVELFVAVYLNDDDDVHDVTALVQDVRYETGNIKPPADDEVLSEYAKQYEMVLFDDGTPGALIRAGIQRLQTHLR